MEVPETIVCVECGAAAGRITPVPEDEGFLPGDVIAFVCPDCGHRFDVVLEDEAGSGT
jgi:hypothetical protein